MLRRLLTPLLLLAFLSLSGCATTPAAGPDAAGESPPGAAMEEKWGIEIVALRLSARNRMLDFRYRVLDPDKAAPLFRRKTKPLLVHGKTGRELHVHNPAKLGPMRSSNPPQAGRTYFILFSNVGRVVQSGDEATLVIGDFRAEGLVVE